MSTRRQFTLLDALAESKRFHQRRAGLLPRDDGADQAFLKMLLIIEPAAPRQPWHLRRARPLTPEEGERYLLDPLSLGGLGEIVLAAAWAARTSERVSQDRLTSARRAERAEREALRLKREAARFDAAP